MFFARHAGLAAVLIAAAVLPLRADVARDATTCSDGRATLERVIDACTGVIDDASVAPAIKLTAYVRRAAATFEHTGEVDQAIADLTAALKIKADDADTLAMRGGLYLINNEFEKSIADFNEALKLVPEHLPSLAGRANAYVQFGDGEKAIADFSEVIRLKPDDAGAYYDRGGAYEKKSDFDNARADYERAIKLQRDYAGEFPDTCFGMNDKGESGLKNWPGCEEN